MRLRIHESISFWCKLAECISEFRCGNGVIKSGSVDTLDCNPPPALPPRRPPWPTNNLSPASPGRALPLTPPNYPAPPRPPSRNGANTCLSSAYILGTCRDLFFVCFPFSQRGQQSRFLRLCCPLLPTTFSKETDEMMMMRGSMRLAISVCQARYLAPFFLLFALGDRSLVAAP